MMKYLPKAPNDDTRDPYGEDFVCEPYDLAKYMNVAQTQYSSEENISFSAITQALQWPLLFFFDADGSINVSFTYLDVTFSEEYKLADLNLVLLNLFKFFHSNHCDILNYKVEWGD